MYSTGKQVYNIEWHMRSIMVYMVRRNQLALTSEKYFFKTAPVFTLEPACGHSQLQEPTQFIRVVQVGLSPP